MLGVVPTLAHIRVVHNLVKKKTLRMHHTVIACVAMAAAVSGDGVRQWYVGHFSRRSPSKYTDEWIPCHILLDRDHCCDALGVVHHILSHEAPCHSMYNTDFMCVCVCVVYP